MRKFLLLSWSLILFHAVKDIFQDLLETDFLYFLDLALDPRLKNPQLFFDKSSRKTASQAKQEYLDILRQGPF